MAGSTGIASVAALNLSACNFYTHGESCGPTPASHCSQDRWTDRKLGRARQEREIAGNRAERFESTVSGMLAKTATDVDNLTDQIYAIANIWNDVQLFSNLSAEMLTVHLQLKNGMTGLRDSLDLAAGEELNDVEVR